VRRIISWTAVVLTALVLQSTILAQIRLGGAKPELLYLVTIVLAFLEGPSSGALAGFFGGMAQDFLLSQPKGITALTLTLLGYAIGMGRQFITTESPLLPVVIVALGTAAGSLFASLVTFLLGQLKEGIGVGEVVQTALLSAVYNAILTPLVFPLIRRIAAASRPRRMFPV
jgi:rod shape-determining protein MreD